MINMSRLIDGRAIAAKIRSAVKEEIAKFGLTPGLAVILVGTDPASHLYVSLKQKACEEVGIKMETHLEFATISEEKILKKIEELNKRPDIHAILLQLPLPQPLNANRLVAAIDPEKDVDGFHPQNISNFIEGHAALTPVLVAGIKEILKSTGEDFNAKQGLIIAKSSVFTKPLSKGLNYLGLWSAIIAPSDEELAAKAREADVLITAIGRPNAITRSMIKPGAVIIDIGTNRQNDKTVGDVDAAAAAELAAWYTPVPGGMGPVTVAMLLKNTVTLCNNYLKTYNL